MIVKLPEPEAGLFTPKKKHESEQQTGKAIDKPVIERTEETSTSAPDPGEASEDFPPRLRATQGNQVRDQHVEQEQCCGDDEKLRKPQSAHRPREHSEQSSLR